MNQLDPDPSRRGKQFEHICKWYLQNDSLYADQLKSVWLWKEWPKRWKQAEAGIDLVAQTRDGNLWAIQAKDYVKDIPKNEMDKFLAESARKGTNGKPLFAFRLLITTADGLAFHAQDIAGASLIDVGVVNRAKLATAEINWPDSYEELRAIPQRAPKTPLPYQEEATTQVVAGFAMYDRGQLIMPCGTGKTLTSLFIREALQVKNTLVLVPSLQLLGQTAREWLANRSADFIYKPVCSSKSVVGDDETIESTVELGFPVTTNASEIASFLRKASHHPRVVFSTYQSSAEVSKALHKKGVPAFDLVIADEAHRTAGAVDSEFAAVLDDKKIPAKRRLFMTATPRYFTGRVRKGAKEQFDFEQASMDDDAKYGPKFYQMTFQQARSLGRLCDYEVNIILVKGDDPDYQEYLTWAIDRHFIQTGKSGAVTSARRVAIQIALIRSIKQYVLHRVIAFFSRVNASRSFAETLTEVVAWLDENDRPTVKIWARHVDGGQSALERDQALEQLRNVTNGECGILTNARCLNEGIDVPALDCAVFVDPKGSPIDIIQSIGRVLRVAPGKTKGHILIPVFIKAEDDPEEALEGSAFQPVWDVAKALRSHDVQLGEWIDDYRFMLGRLGKQRIGPVEPPEEIKPPFGHSIDRKKFAQAFMLKFVEQTSEPFEFWLGLMKRYVDDSEGNASPLATFKTEDGWALGSKVNTWRSWKKKGWLTADRVKQIEETIPGWTWDALDDQWQETFRHFREYAEREQNTRVPDEYESPDGFPLGRRLNTLRSQYNKGVLQAKFPERIQQLEALPGGWIWDARTARWQGNLDKYLRCVEQTGTAQLTKETEFEGFGVGAWIASQRKLLKAGRLQSDRKKQLDEAVPGWREGNTPGFPRGRGNRRRP